MITASVDAMCSQLALVQAYTAGLVPRMTWLVLARCTPILALAQRTQLELTLRMDVLESRVLASR